MAGLRVLIGSNVHWWNAEAAYAAQTAQILLSAGCQVWVIAPANTKNFSELKKRKIPVITNINLNSKNPLRLYHSYLALRKFVLDHQIQILNPHQSAGLFLYTHLRQKFTDLRLIKTRGTASDVQAHTINQKIYQLIDSHIFAGRVIQSNFTQKISVSARKCHLIYYPMGLSLNETQQCVYRREWQIPPEAQVLAIVGRLGRVKGHHLLFQSFQQLLALCPQTILLVIHTHLEKDRPELLLLQAYAAILGISSSIRFIGPREDIASIMKFADIGVVSSIDSEVICRVATEFFSQGTPVVALPTGCLPEIIFNGINGMVATDRSASALTSAIAPLLLHPHLLSDLKNSTYQMSNQVLSSDQFLQKTLEAFTTTY